MHPTVIVTNVTFSSRRKAISAKRFAVKGIRKLSPSSLFLHLQYFKNQFLIVGDLDLNRFGEAMRQALLVTSVIVVSGNVVSMAACW